MKISPIMTTSTRSVRSEAIKKMKLSTAHMARNKLIAEVIWAAGMLVAYRLTRAA